jgi:hypothetical protein
MAMVTEAGVPKQSNKESVPAVFLFFLFSSGRG